MYSKVLGASVACWSLLTTVSSLHIPPRAVGSIAASDSDLPVALQNAARAPTSHASSTSSAVSTASAAKTPASSTKAVSTSGKAASTSVKASSASGKISSATSKVVSSATQSKATKTESTTATSASSSHKSPSLCEIPNPKTSKAADAAYFRGVPAFLDSYITNILKPHDGTGGWLNQMAVQFQLATTMDCHNLGSQSCKTLDITVCTSKDVAAQEAFWTIQNAANLFGYFSVMSSMFNIASAEANYDIGSISDTIKPQVPPKSGIKEMLSIMGAAFSLGGPLGGPAGASLEFIGGVFSNVATLLPDADGDPGSTATALADRMNRTFTEVNDGINNFLKAFFVDGTLDNFKGLENSYPPGSDFKHSISKFMDMGRFMYGTDSIDSVKIQSQFRDNLRMNLVGVALVEANYYIVKDGFASKDCPTSGTVIKDSCYTLEAPGRGGSPQVQLDRDAFSIAINGDLLGTITNKYKVNMNDLYQVSIDCQNKHNAYGATGPIGLISTDTKAIPECFYNLPVLQAKVDGNPQERSPCYVASGNNPTKGVGTTTLPDNLVKVFRPGGINDFYCAYPAEPVVPIGV